MNKKSIDALIKKLDKDMVRIGQARDRLDDTISTAEELREHCSEAWEDLQRARDTLSQLV